MTNHFENAAERAIEMMQGNLGEQLTIDDMARAAMFSKFHFTRIFQRATGVSPRRFLSALRLQQAKQLLLSTSMNVADISIYVGYNSVGTFSSRFTRSVGVAPTEYRRLGGVVPNPPRSVAVDTPGSGTVAGLATCSGVEDIDTLFLGLFKTRIPEGQPAACAIRSGTGRFEMHGVPAGEWHVLGHGIASSSDDVNGEPAVYVGSLGPIRIEPGAVVNVRLRLTALRSLDPPLLLALPDARTAFGLPDSKRPMAASARIAA